MSVRGWNGDRIARKVRAEEKRRIARASLVVNRRAKELLSVSGVGGQIKGGYAVQGGRGKRIYNAFPSRPGEPPHKQRGTLRANVSTELGDRGGVPFGRIGPGSLTPYGKFLELGTSRMKPRPWLVRAFRESYAQIRAILTAPIR